MNAEEGEEEKIGLEAAEAAEDRAETRTKLKNIWDCAQEFFIPDYGDTKGLSTHEQSQGRVPQEDDLF